MLNIYLYSNIYLDYNIYVKYFNLFWSKQIWPLHSNNQI